MTSDIYTVQILHRVLIALAGTGLVLAVMSADAAHYRLVYGRLVGDFAAKF